MVSVIMIGSEELSAVRGHADDSLILDDVLMECLRVSPGVREATRANEQMNRTTSRPVLAVVASAGLAKTEPCRFAWVSALVGC